MQLSLKGLDPLGQCWRGGVSLPCPFPHGWLSCRRCADKSQTFEFGRSHRCPKGSKPFRLSCTLNEHIGFILFFHIANNYVMCHTSTDGEEFRLLFGLLFVKISHTHMNAISTPPGHTQPTNKLWILSFFALKLDIQPVKEDVKILWLQPPDLAASSCQLIYEKQYIALECCSNLVSAWGN